MGQVMDEIPQGGSVGEQSAQRPRQRAFKFRHQRRDEQQPPLYTLVWEGQPRGPSLPDGPKCPKKGDKECSHHPVIRRVKLQPTGSAPTGEFRIEEKQDEAFCALDKKGPWIVQTPSQKNFNDLRFLHLPKHRKAQK